MRETVKDLLLLKCRYIPLEPDLHKYKYTNGEILPFLPGSHNYFYPIHRNTEWHGKKNTLCKNTRSIFWQSYCPAASRNHNWSIPFHSQVLFPHMLPGTSSHFPPLPANESADMFSWRKSFWYRKVTVPFLFHEYKDLSLLPFCPCVFQWINILSLSDHSAVNMNTIFHPWSRFFLHSLSCRPAQTRTTSEAAHMLLSFAYTQISSGFCHNNRYVQHFLLSDFRHW